MIEKKTLEILKLEIDLLEKKLYSIKLENTRNKELTKIKDLLQKNPKSLIDINVVKFLKLLENYNILDFDEFKKEIKYVKYMYEYYYTHKEEVDFPQKEIADRKYEKIKNIICNIDILENNYQEEILNIHNRLKIVYDNLTKNIYTKPITEYDVINYIMKSPNITKEQKEQFEKNINSYNDHINKIINNYEIEAIKENNSKEQIKKIDPHIKSFAEMLKVLEKDQIINYLPSSVMENCVYVLEGIIDYMEYEINRNNSIVEENSDIKIVSDIREENLKLENIKQCVIQYLNQVLREEELEEEFGSNIMINKIFYLNNYIFNDLKDVTEEEYESVNSSIDALITGDLSTNTAKHRKLKNNASLKNVFEIKRSRVRLFYTPIGKNTYAVLLLGQKNTNNDIVLIEKAEKRVSEFRQLEKKGNINIDNLVETGLEITDQIKKILQEKKRKM